MREKMTITPSGEIIYGFQYIESLPERVFSSPELFKEELDLIEAGIRKLEECNRIVDRDSMFSPLVIETSEKSEYVFKAMKETMKIKPTLMDFIRLNSIICGKTKFEQKEAWDTALLIKSAIPEVDGHERVLQFALMV